MTHSWTTRPSIVIVSKNPSWPSTNSSTATVAPWSTWLRAIASSSSSTLPTRWVPEAPAPVVGLTMSGKPTSDAKARTSEPDDAPVERAVGTPAARSASFMAGLSRHRKVVRTEVPGMPHASRTSAAVMTWASTVASSRSTQTLSCSQRTASTMRPPSTTDGTCS